MRNSIIHLIIIFVVFASCGPREQVSKDVFEEVNQAMEVKRLSEAEIIQEALILGDSISLEAQKQLVSNLQKAIAEKGVAGAVEFCNVQASPILKEVSQKYGVEIRRASNRYRNPADQPDEEEKPILEAYEYNVESHLESEPNIQKIQGGETLLFTKAIVIPGGFCLSCHGDPEKDIDAATLEKVNSLYPGDRAKDHKLGDLRGMWSIRIPKKEVVKRM